MWNKNEPTLFETALLVVCIVVIGALCLLLSGCAYYQRTERAGQIHTTFVLVGTGNRAANISTNGSASWRHSEIPQVMELAGEGVARGVVKGALGK